MGEKDTGGRAKMIVDDNPLSFTCLCGQICIKKRRTEFPSSLSYAFFE